MKITFDGQYKALGPFTWEVPPFAIVTGINGSGKTQLLDLIRMAIQEPPNQGIREHVQITDFEIEAWQVLHISMYWEQLQEMPAVGLLELQSDAESQWNQFQNWRDKHRHGQPGLLAMEPYHELFSAIVKRLDKSRDQITRAEFISAIPNEVIPTRRCHIFNDVFGQTCLRYEMRLRDLRANGMSFEQIEEVNGPPPWKVLNEVFNSASLRFRVTDPSKLDILDKFKCSLTNLEDGKQVDFNDLSSGERIIVSLVFWLYSSRHPAKLPKLLLLDEPDAYLHPSMVRQFLDVVFDTFVRKHGVHVIMTSHAPSTVALAPDDSIYEIRCRPETSISKVDSRNATRSLAQGLITVKPGARWVLVEDRADVDFYSEICRREGLVNHSRSTVDVAFLSAGAESKESESGGRGRVEKWVPKLRAAGFTEVFGLVDCDKKGSLSDGLRCLGRFSIENYLIDPLVVFAALVEARQPLQVKGVSVQVGAEHEMYAMGQDKLDEIVRHVIAVVEPKIPDLIPSNKETVEVAYVNGARGMLPKWLLSMRGKDLLKTYRDCFRQPNMDPKKLRTALLRTRFIPDELLELLRELHMPIAE